MHNLSCFVTMLGGIISGASDEAMFFYSAWNLHCPVCYATQEAPDLAEFPTPVLSITAWKLIGQLKTQRTVRSGAFNKSCSEGVGAGGYSIAHG
ncbi:uncharacterized protein LOC125454422 isoform X3 [Stegostoma tigrinum]|uniref:uncharacterized protein LOC125454422 isoform X3 n=1 Tax=Stegostoma tigrinum TaxID=3053191 RepID=UPI0028705326|nr:uncharacterized protein LOC125454422 isoform X3 [Stegostoma tigrinum]